MWKRDRSRRIKLSIFTRLNWRSEIQKETSNLVEISSGPSLLLAVHTGPFHELSHPLCKTGFSNLLKIEETSTAVFSLGLKSKATTGEAEARPPNPAIQWEASLGQDQGW